MYRATWLPMNGRIVEGSATPVRHNVRMCGCHDTGISSVIGSQVACKFPLCKPTAYTCHPVLYTIRVSLEACAVLSGAFTLPALWTHAVRITMSSFVSLLTSLFMLCPFTSQVPERRCLHAPSPARRTSLSSPSPVPSLWRCLWVLARAACATCSARPRRTHPASSSSMRSVRVPVLLQLQS